MLPQLQLYQLRAQLRINPILERKTKDFNLTFDVRTGAFRADRSSSSRCPQMLTRASGEAGGLTAGRLPVELAGHRMEPATHPRVQQLYLITNRSPWYTLIENKDGVTVGDVFNQVTLEYVLSIPRPSTRRSSPQTCLALPLIRLHSRQARVAS